LRLASSSEDISDSFVDNAMTLHKRALSFVLVRAVVDTLQDMLGHGSPWNSVTKMYKVVSKARTPRQILWAFVSITDFFQSGMLHGGDLSVRALAGDGGSNRGLVDLCSYTLEIKDYMLSTFLDTHSFEPEAKQGIRDVLMDHSTYRKNLSPFTETPLDLSWQVGWPSSGKLMLEFIEELVYLNELDGPKKMALKGRRSPEELLAYGDVQQRLEVILETLQGELKAKAVLMEADRAATEAADNLEKDSASGNGAVGGGTGAVVPASSSSSISVNETDPDRIIAARTVAVHCNFVVETSAGAMTTAMQSCKPGNLPGGNGDARVLLNLDTKLLGLHTPMPS
jgi:hypothetical protein